MRENRSQNLQEMPAEAKNAPELTVGLAYAALFYGSEDSSEEVIGQELEGLRE